MLFGKSKDGKNYKFKSLQSYAWDRAMGNKRKFRKVFDKNEITYLSTELAFYNKLFDENDWQAEIHLRAVKMNGGKMGDEICTKQDEITISKEDNIITYTFGWGEDERGKYWKPGKYRWIAEIDGEEVGTTDFFIEDYDRVTEKNNPYFEALTFRTYEAPAGDREEKSRDYLKTFSATETRYIMGELRFLNKITEDWVCELFFNFIDDTGQVIGSSDTMVYITPKEGVGECFTITSGWGSENRGTWIEDNYRVEVVFMDTIVAVIPFSVGQSFVRRMSEYEALLNEDVAGLYNPTHVSPQNLKNKETDDSKKTASGEPDNNSEEEAPPEVEIEIDDRPLTEILADLNGLIGLENIKNKVREYVDYVSFLQYRKENGFHDEDEIILHSVFTGNPGTGKTTVVKLLGKIFHSMGLLSKGHVHEVEANDLISGFVRQTGKDTKEAIEKARGGILFIDEAYSLFKEGASSDFGPEAIAALITEMSDGAGDLAIMVAGYPKEMDTFIKSNPGLKSRFKHYFHFEDYTPDELVEIAQYAAKKKDVKLSPEAQKRLLKLVTTAYRKRDKSFGNARFATALVDEAKMNMGVRVVKQHDPEKLNKNILSVIQPEDIEDMEETSTKKKLELPIDNDQLKLAIDELNQLTGLENIKQEINELVKLTRYYKEMNRDVLKAFSMHSIFTGNPGTGKTTVARIIGKIYKALGLLERGHLVDADGSSLVAGFVGQTALKTKELIAQAMGGVLFIDEAYSLTEGRNNEFGKQAVAAFIKEMEDQRGNFSLIVAGYTENMQEFLKSNPGLESRFDNTFLFNDFNESQLYSIVLGMFKSKGLAPDTEAEQHLKAYIAFLYQNRNRFFGNARSMRKVVEKSIRNQELRMADLPQAQRTSQAMVTVLLADVKEFEPQKSLNKPSLGFKFNGD
ncbi:MAG: AAA family ATPase [Bacteroidales bacterium]|nr:AAA family ATPase [Bacteroidales bacterium]